VGFTFDPKRATALAWSIEVADNASLVGEEAAIFIDNVVLKGTFDFIPPEICMTNGVSCASNTFNIPATSLKISDFSGRDYTPPADVEEDEDFLKNVLGYYWYAYDDNTPDASGARGTSTIIWTAQDYNGDDIMDVVGQGRDGSNAAFVEYVKGSAFGQSESNPAGIESFIGIGVNLYDDSLKTDFANAIPFSGIYFEYRTAAGINWIDVEMADDFDAIGDAANLDGEVFFTRVPGTNGQWMSATVPFSAFVLPTWVTTSGERRIPSNSNPNSTSLNFGKLAQVKFVHKGGMEQEYDFAINNLYFYGATEFGPPGSVKVVGKAARTTGLRATYSRGVVGVNWNAASQVASGKISLVNTKGRVIASAPISKTSGNRISASLGKSVIPTGMYFVRIDARDVNGKRIVQQAPISIVK